MEQIGPEENKAGQSEESCLINHLTQEIVKDESNDLEKLQKLMKKLAEFSKIFFLLFRFTERTMYW